MPKGLASWQQDAEPEVRDAAPWRDDARDQGCERIRRLHQTLGHPGSRAGGGSRTAPGSAGSGAPPPPVRPGPLSQPGSSAPPVAALPVEGVLARRATLVPWLQPGRCFGGLLHSSRHGEADSSMARPSGRPSVLAGRRRTARGDRGAPCDRRSAGRGRVPVGGEAALRPGESPRWPPASCLGPSSSTGSSGRWRRTSGPGPASGNWRKPLGRGAASLPGSGDVAVTDGKSRAPDTLRSPEPIARAGPGAGRPPRQRRTGAPSPAGPDPCAPGGLIRPVPGHREEDG